MVRLDLAPPSKDSQGKHPRSSTAAANSPRRGAGAAGLRNPAPKPPAVLRGKSRLRAAANAVRAAKSVSSDTASGRARDQNVEVAENARAMLSTVATALVQAATASADASADEAGAWLPAGVQYLGSVLAAIICDKATATAFWCGLAMLDAHPMMEKADLCKFMSASVAAAISGDEAEAAAFWDGLRVLQPYFTPPELAKFMCNSIAFRLKKNQGTDIAAVVERLGAKRTKTVLTRPLLLRVLPEFVEYMSTIDDAVLWSAIATFEGRKCLLEKLETTK